MNKLKIVALRILLLMVIVAEVNSILQANINPAKYVLVFPGASGFLFYFSQFTSFAALVNCVMIWLWKKWAIWTNVVIGVWSITLVQILEGPPVNQMIILIATSGVFLLSLSVLDRFQSHINSEASDSE